MARSRTTVPCPHRWQLLLPCGATTWRGTCTAPGRADAAIHALAHCGASFLPRDVMTGTFAEPSKKSCARHSGPHFARRDGRHPRHFGRRPGHSAPALGPRQLPTLGSSPWRRPQARSWSVPFGTTALGAVFLLSARTDAPGAAPRVAAAPAGLELTAELVGSGTFAVTETLSGRTTSRRRSGLRSPRCRRSPVLPASRFARSATCGCGWTPARSSPFSTPGRHRRGRYLLRPGRILRPPR